MIVIQEQADKSIRLNQAFLDPNLIIKKLPSNLKPILITLHQTYIKLQISFDILPPASSYIKITSQMESIQLQTLLRLVSPSNMIPSSIVRKQISNLNTQGTQKVSWDQKKNEIIVHQRIQCPSQIQQLGRLGDFHGIEPSLLVERIINHKNALEVLLEKCREIKKSRQSKILVELKYFRKQFQKERTTRTKSTQISSLDMDEIQINIAQLFQNTHDKRKIHRNFQKVKLSAKPDTQKRQTQFKARLKAANAHHHQSILHQTGSEAKQISEQNLQPILTPIQIHNINVLPDYSQSQGFFGSIRKVQCTYVQLTSTNQESSNIIINYFPQKKQEEQLKTSQLIRKQAKSIDEEFISSLKIQLFLLKHLRRQRCRQIAQYFWNCSCDEQQLVIYSKYYPAQFDNFRNLKSKIMALVDLCFGINFLIDRRVIHRDLKPDNLRIEHSKNCQFVKIIDFGSSSPIHGYSWNLDTRYEIPRTTKNYSIQYCQAATQIHTLLNKREFDQHHLYDLYSFGRITEGLLPQNHFDGVLRDTINYMIGKCVEWNPQDRLTPNQALIILYYIDNLI